MAKTKTSNLQNLKQKKSKKSTEHLHISLTKKNYSIIVLGIIVIIIGYILMDQNSVDGFMPTVVAPILLFVGYCVIIPVGILLKDNPSKETADSGDLSFVKEDETGTKPKGNVSSNIKTA
ncbi:MAG TPA: hypothetical protein VHP32_09010 [Ignavibacteria bacterium]|nr:hypothetical protein [Ignavibacteria bacterium]